MKRFLLLLRNEFALFRTAIPIHLVAILQPPIMYLLISAILVHPTFDMAVARPAPGAAGDLTARLVGALEQVGSPAHERAPAGSAGALPYVRVLISNWEAGDVARQVVRVEDRGGTPTAVQHYGLIDSNLVKNFRNRLTAAALRLWDAELGPRAVTVAQRPWLPRDVPYNVYFGMALLPMATFLAAAIVGAMLSAQEFEFRTVLEYRLAPARPGLVLAARLARLVLSALLSAGLVCLAVAFVNGAWPRRAWLAALTLLPVGVIGGCLGVTAGLLLRRSIPAFLVALVCAFAGWILGGAFGLASSFGTTFERLSRLTPFSHAVELLFPRYFGATVGSPLASALVLALMAGAMVALTALVYRRRILREEGA